MSVTLVNTWGSPSANVYVTLAEANVIISESILDTSFWENLDEDKMNRSLAIGAGQIDGGRWFGMKFYEDQRLQFPRVPSGYEEATYRSLYDGGAVFNSVMVLDAFLQNEKRRVQTANVLQAAYLLQTAPSTGRSDKHRDLQRRGVGSWSLSMGGVSQSWSYSKSETLAPEVWDLLYYYKGSARLVRGDQHVIGELD